jgi:predicted  nucleic acid-binding Zn ribbon protein
MADPNSKLAQDGRDLCRGLETATGLPTFYYLHRYWGRPKGEEDRLCPGCGGKWRTGAATGGKRLFWQFDFRCDPCRLVSHFGVSTDGGRHTRIGEFQGERAVVSRRVRQG